MALLFKLPLLSRLTFLMEDSRNRHRQTLKALRALIYCRKLLICRLKFAKEQILGYHFLLFSVYDKYYRIDLINSDY